MLQLLQFNVDGHTITRDLCSEEEMSLYIPVIRAGAKGEGMWPPAAAVGLVLTGCWVVLMGAAFQKEELEAKRQKIRVLFGKNEYQAARTIAVRSCCLGS